MAQAAHHTIALNDLARAAYSLRKETATALARVVDSGRYVHGPECEVFEKEFAAYIGVDFCIGVANGTDALELALLGVGCEQGDEVVTAANAGMYTTTAALRAGLRLRYADVDAGTLCLSCESVAAVLRPGTSAVV